MVAMVSEVGLEMEGWCVRLLACQSLEGFAIVGGRKRKDEVIEWQLPSQQRDSIVPLACKTYAVAHDDKPISGYFARQLPLFRLGAAGSCCLG